MEDTICNDRGLQSKMPSAKNIMSELMPDIVLIAETHLAENKGTRLEGYTFFGNPRKQKKGGGVGIFVKNERKAHLAPHYSMRALEIVWISMDL